MSEPVKQRNARACEACRASKTRCIYKSDVGDCQRCQATGSQCIIRSKARPGRTRAIRPSSGLNKNPKSGSIFSDSADFSIELPGIDPPDTGKDLVDLHNHHKEFFDDDDSPRESQHHDPVPIEKRQVTLQKAEELLSMFRRKASSFPFVQVSQEATVPSLARESPFLLLAMLATASINDRSLYHQLDHEFRRILSMKCIVEGQKSLDYLQGLLVYIAWYPIHVSPKNNQSFMYMNLAISLVGDLGIDREKPGLMGFTAIDTEGLIEGDDFSKAAKRAYLGTYYLSSAWPIRLSMGFQKANNMQYRNLMDTHGESLLHNEQSPDIYSIVKLQRLSERIAELHNSKHQADEVGVDPLNDEVNIQMFQDELEQWRRSTSDFFRNLPIVGIAERFVGMQIYGYQLGFLKRPYRAHLESTALQPVNPAHLTSCLEACKKSFEYSLSLPEETYSTFTIVQWAVLVQAILTLSRLTFLMAKALGWDAETTRSNIPLVMYLDCLCYRFQSLTSTLPEGGEPPKRPDAPYVMKMMLESVKKSYERRVAKIEPGLFVINDGYGSGIAKGHCPIMDPTLKTLFDNAALTYDESFSMSGTPASTASSSSIPLYHDLWATMTGSWAAEV